MRTSAYEAPASFAALSASVMSSSAAVSRQVAGFRAGAAFAAPGLVIAGTARRAAVAAVVFRKSRRFFWSDMAVLVRGARAGQLAAGRRLRGYSRARGIVDLRPRVASPTPHDDATYPPGYHPTLKNLRSFVAMPTTARHGRPVLTALALLAL